jgi:hypothetical protein
VPTPRGVAGAAGVLRSARIAEADGIADLFLGLDIFVGRVVVAKHDKSRLEDRELA